MTALDQVVLHLVLGLLLVGAAELVHAENLVGPQQELLVLLQRLGLVEQHLLALHLQRAHARGVKALGEASSGQRVEPGPHHLRHDRRLAVVPAVAGAPHCAN